MFRSGVIGSGVFLVCRGQPTSSQAVRCAPRVLTPNPAVNMERSRPSRAGSRSLVGWAPRQEEKRKRSAEVEKALREAEGDEPMVAAIRRRAEREEAKHKASVAPRLPGGARGPSHASRGVLRNRRRRPPRGVRGCGLRRIFEDKTRPALAGSAMCPSFPPSTPPRPFLSLAFIVGGQGADGARPTAGKSDRLFARTASSRVVTRLPARGSMNRGDSGAMPRRRRPPSRPHRGSGTPPPLTPPPYRSWFPGLASPGLTGEGFLPRGPADRPHERFCLPSSRFR